MTDTNDREAAVARLIAWARDEQAFPVGNPGGCGRDHIDENHRFILRDMIDAIDAAAQPAGGDGGAVKRVTHVASADAAAHLAIRSPLNRAIYSAVRDYRLLGMADEDGYPYPLVDLLSNPAPADIGTGEMEMIAFGR